MPLIIIVMAAGLFIELLGSIVSVIGVSSMFGGNLLIVAFALALDVGKIATISALYQYWSKLTTKLGYALRAGGLVLVLATVGLSSYGAAGYLNGEFQKAMAGTQESNMKVEALESQLAKYEARKVQIDSQIANLPEKTSAAQRIRMINTFKAEQVEVAAKITAIEAQLPDLKTENIQKNVKAGPVLALSKALDIPLERALNIVVGMLIVVFNPFAVFLVLLGNFMIKEYKNSKKVIFASSPVTNVPAAFVAPVAAPVVAEEVQAEVAVIEPEVLVEETPAAVAEEPAYTIELDNFEAAPEVQAEVTEEPVLKATPVTEITVDLPATLTRFEQAKQARRTSLLLDAALQHVNDGTVMSATPVKNIEVYRQR